MNLEKSSTSFTTQVKRSFNRILKQFNNPIFQKQYTRQFITYSLLMLGYATIIAVTKYNEVKIDLIESALVKSFTVALRQISFLVLLPLSVVAVIPIRNRINPKEPSSLYVFAVIFASVISTICYQLENSYPTFALFLYSCVVRPLFNTLYFYYITDLFQSYNYKFGYIDVLLLGITAQSFASIVKILGFTLFETIGYNMFVHLGFMAFAATIVRILERYYPSDSVFRPNTNVVNLGTVFKLNTFKKLIKNKFAIMIIINTFIFTVLNEVYGNVKIEHIHLRNLISRAPVLYQVPSIQVIQEPVPGQTSIAEIGYMHILGTRLRNLYRKITRTNKDLPQSATPNIQGNLKTVKVITTVVKHERINVTKDQFVHFRENIYETIFCQLIQLMMFLVLTVCYSVQKYKTLGPAVTYCMVPFFAVLNAIIYNDNVLFLVYLFSAIDTGGKKSTKDFAYTPLEFQSRNFIKLYNEYAIEPLSRLVGGFIGLKLRGAIKTTNGINLNNLHYLKFVSVGLCLSWLLVTIYQTYSVEQELKLNRRTNIFEED